MPYDLNHDGKEDMRCYEFVREHYQRFLTRWDLQAPFLSPSRVGILSTRTPGENQMQGVYDSTTLGAADLLAKYIGSTTFGPGQRWGKNKPKKFGLSDRDEVDDWCDEVTDRMLAAYGSSNFYREAPECLNDWVAFGTGSLLQEERPEYASDYEERRGGFRGLRFQTDKTGRFFNSCNAEGVIDKEYRETQLSVRAAIEKFGKESLPENMAKCVGTEKEETLFTFVHGVCPRPKIKRKGNGALGYPWASWWTEKESKERVHEGGYKMYPFCNPRWEITPGEIPGRGPGDRAFPDTRTLNRAKQLDLEALALDIRKPYAQASDSIIPGSGGVLKLRPAGGVVVKIRPGQAVKDVLAPIDMNPNYKMSQIKEEELRISINQLFFVDILRALLKVEKSEMTAFEFAQKLQLMYRIIGGVYGGYEYDFLARTWDNTFSIMDDAGALPPAPPIMLDEGRNIAVEFTSPLALAQKSQDADGILRGFSAIPTIALNDPQRAIELKDNLDDDRAVRRIFDMYGVPADVIRSEEKRDEIRAARTKARQDEAQMQQMQGASEAMRNAAPLITALKPDGANAA